MVTGCLRVTKFTIFAVYNNKKTFVKYEKYGTLSLYFGIVYNTCRTLGNSVRNGTCCRICTWEAWVSNIGAILIDGTS